MVPGWSRSSHGRFKGQVPDRNNNNNSARNGQPGGMVGGTGESCRRLMESDQFRTGSISIIFNIQRLFPDLAIVNRSRLSPIMDCCGLRCLIDGSIEPTLPDARVRWGSWGETFFSSSLKNWSPRWVNGIDGRRCFMVNDFFFFFCKDYDPQQTSPVEDRPLIGATKEELNPFAHRARAHDRCFTNIYKFRAKMDELEFRGEHHDPTTTDSTIRPRTTPRFIERFPMQQKWVRG